MEAREIKVGDEILLSGASKTVWTVDAISAKGVFFSRPSTHYPEARAWDEMYCWQHRDGAPIAATAPTSVGVIEHPEARIEKLAKALFKTDEKVLTFAKTVSEFGAERSVKVEGLGTLTSFSYDYAKYDGVLAKMWERNEKEWRTAALNRARAMLESGF